MPFWPNYHRVRIHVTLWLLAVCMLGSSGATIWHDFHSSITELEYNAASGKYEVAIRVFTDDLEATINAGNTGAKLVVDTGASTDEHIARYMKKAFVIYDKAQKPKPTTFIGKELDGEVTWVYMEVEGVVNPQEIIIYNAVLVDTFSDQKNIVNCKIKGARKSFLFDKKRQKHAF
jgi:hypothetical protein